MPITKTKISYFLDLSKELDQISSNREKTKFKREVEGEVLSLIFDITDDAISPVTGKAFKKLKPKYAAIKIKQGQPGIPNLRLKEKMLPSIGTQIKQTGIDYKITNSTEKKKAHNNIKGITKGMPRGGRPFLPDDSKSSKSVLGTFSSPIKKRIRELLKEAKQRDRESEEENNV